MFCTDPYIASLKSFGYNVVHLPKADIRPLEVLLSKGRNLNRLGMISTVLIPGKNVNVPGAEENIPCASISGKRTNDLKVGIGLSILGNIISAMGGSEFGLDLQYKQAKTIAFEFSDIFANRVPILEIDRYLANADIDPFAKHSASLLEADDLLIITETIKSSTISVEAKDSNGQTINLNVPVIKGIVGGNVELPITSETSSKITFQSKIQLVFGFQAIRIFYENGEYKAFKPVTGGIELKALDQAPNDGASRFMSDSAFVNFYDRG